MLIQSKSYYVGIGKGLGMSWVCCDDGIHLFQSGSYRSGFSVMYCTEDCLTNGNAAYMVLHGLTLSDEKVRELQRKYRRKHKIAA